jgi:hypothetical protein
MPPQTHYEVHVVIDETPVKVDLTVSGYRLYYQASPPPQGYFQPIQPETPQGLKAADVYEDFLEVAKGLGPYDAESNDCEDFALRLVDTVLSRARKSANINADMSGYASDGEEKEFYAEENVRFEGETVSEVDSDSEVEDSDSEVEEDVVVFHFPEGFELPKGTD